MTHSPLLALSHLDLSFGAVQALDDVSLEIEAGESFGIVGESGSGKSTLLRLLCGLAKPDKGQIIYNSKDINSFNNSELSDVLNMVFQDPYGAFNPTFRVGKILAEPFKVMGQKVSEKNIADALISVGLPRDLTLRYPHELSGGQRQRLSIARALMKRPAILLLDEPTSALDVSVQAEILNLLSLRRRQDGLTYLLVSHDLAVIAHMCDRLAVMREGRVVEILSATDLRAGKAASAYTRALMEAAGIL